MNDLSLQGKVLRNKNLITKIQVYTLPIGWTLGLLVLKFTIQFVKRDFAYAPQVARQFSLFVYLVMIGSTFWLFYGSLYMLKRFNAIKVTESSIILLGLFGKEQIVRWEEISAIQKSSSQKNVILQKEWNIYQVKTTIPGKFSLLKKSKFFFYITYNHESHKELLALLKEKTGLKIEEPTRKPKISPWQSGTRL